MDNNLDEIKSMKLKIIFQLRLEKELTSKNISKYIASLDYLDKSLNVLSILSGSISITSFATISGAPAGILGQVVVLRFQLHHDL